MPKFPDESPLDYLQSRGLRVLATNAFKFFYERLEYTAGNYLEIGTFEGFMLRELSKLYPEKMFYGIDPFIEDGNTVGHVGRGAAGDPMPDQRAMTLANIAGVQNIQFFPETSRAWGDRHTDAELCALNVRAVFVDGNHSFEQAYYDLHLAKRLICDVGFMYVDDAEHPPVAKALAQFDHPMEQTDGGVVIWL